jgi:Icc protein
MLIAQISDMHIAARGEPGIAGADVIGNLERCVAAINARDPKPDLVLATGDLTADGRDDQYDLLRALMAPLKAPVFMIPGNHDLREGMRRAFPEADYLRGGGAFLQYAVEDRPLRLIGLDTVVPNAPHGELCAERLAWIDARLAEAPERPTIVFMHHHPFASGLEFMDVMGCAGGDALGEIVARNPQIERVLCGHLHRPIQRNFHGTTACVAPSTARQLNPVFGVAEPAEDEVWSDEPPAYLLHLWREGAGVVTHLVQL